MRTFGQPELRDPAILKLVTLAQTENSSVLGIDAGQRSLTYATAHYDVCGGSGYYAAIWGLSHGGCQRKANASDPRAYQYAILVAPPPTKTIHVSYDLKFRVSKLSLYVLSIAYSLPEGRLHASRNASCGESLLQCQPDDLALTCYESRSI